MSMATWNFSQRARRVRPSAIRMTTKLASTIGRELITLASGMPNPLTYPLEQLGTIAAEETSQHEGKSLQYGLTTGFRPLVDWICKYVEKNGIHAVPEQVVCTTGSQQAIDLLTDVLIDPGDRIYVESPTYLGALGSFRKSGAEMVSVRQDHQGILLEDLEEKLKAAPSGCRKLIYLNTNFQNPSGISLSEERRLRLPELLERFDATLIEDDPYGEIYFGESNRPPAPVKSTGSDRIVYLGTFSKLVAPTFRTGWMIGDPALMKRIELTKESADLCSSMLDQRILARFCSSPQFPGHLDSLRAFYAERCSTMLGALKESMPSEVSWTHPGGGFFVWVKLPETMDAESFLEEAILEKKVSFVIGRPFTCDDSAHNFLRLAFSVETPERIREGVRRLAAIIAARL
jgi:2-aminoadipate transaminase